MSRLEAIACPLVPPLGAPQPMEAAKISLPPPRVDATRAHLPDGLRRPAHRLQCGFPTWSPLIAFPFQESIIQFHEFCIREFASRRAVLLTQELLEFFRFG